MRGWGEGDFVGVPGTYRRRLRRHQAGQTRLSAAPCTFRAGRRGTDAARPANWSPLHRAISAPVGGLVSAAPRGRDSAAARPCPVGAHRDLRAAAGAAVPADVVPRAVGERVTARWVAARLDKPPLAPLRGRGGRSEDRRQDSGPAPGQRDDLGPAGGYNRRQGVASARFPQPPFRVPDTGWLKVRRSRMVKQHDPQGLPQLAGGNDVGPGDDGTGAQEPVAGSPLAECGLAAKPFGPPATAGPRVNEVDHEVRRRPRARRVLLGGHSRMIARMRARTLRI